MNIKIKSITLRNFKGLRDVTFDFGGRNATIVGDNGTGKTTVFDALTWVLFGKDSHNCAEIDIKTIDPQTGEPMHRAEHYVEVVLDVDGSVQTLRRTYREIWSKPRGSADLRFVGHETAFAVNGVEVGTKAAYDRIVSEWIGDSVFRMLTDPMYFNTRVDWKGRRRALLELVGDRIDRTELRARFADLLAEMNGEPLADFKVRLAAEKRKNKKELDTFAPKIEAYLNTMPPAEDYAALEREIAELESASTREIAAFRSQIDQINERIADVSKMDAAAQAAHDEKLRRVLRIKQAQSDCIDKRLAAVRRYNTDRTAKIADAQAKAESIRCEIQKAEASAKSKQEMLAACIAKQRSIEASVAAMREEYTATKQAAFEYVDTTVCHACGQPLPAQTVEEARCTARERFEEHQRATLAKLLADANLEKDTHAKLKTLIAKTEREMAMLDQHLSELGSELTAAQQFVESAAAVPVMDLEAEEEQAKLSPEYRKLDDDLRRAQEALQSAADSKTTADELAAKRRELSEKMEAERQACATATAALRRRLANRERAAEVQRLIDEAKEAEKRIAERVAELERLEYAAAAYTKADIEAVEAAINSQFARVRWRMYEQTIEGADVETCVATIDGVPFQSLNSAGQVLAGLDVIRTFCRHYGATAPVFIDNAESISQTDFALDSQVIRLQVVEGAALELKQD
ncbi:AAA family ATPase [Alistipes sp.]|uniref:ATP-binding protein n=1 Tax=Alistipes sp. TaxID=1872444 RepID=UPI003AF060F0